MSRLSSAAAYVEAGAGYASDLNIISQDAGTRRRRPPDASGRKHVYEVNFTTVELNGFVP